MKVSRLGGWSPISPAMKPETVEQWAQRWAKALSDKKGKCDVCGARFTKGMAVKGLKQHANGKPHQKARVRMDLARLLEVHASETIPIHMGTLPERYRQETGRALKQDLEQAGLGKKLRAALEQLPDICDIGEVPSPAGPNHPPAVVMFRVLPVTEQSLGPEPELELYKQPVAVCRLTHVDLCTVVAVLLTCSSLLTEGARPHVGRTSLRRPLAYPQESSSLTCLPLPRAEPGSGCGRLSRQRSGAL